MCHSSYKNWRTAFMADMYVSIFHVYLSVFSVCVSALCVRETFIVQWANCKKSWAAMEASHDALSLFQQTIKSR
jgi:hypothetical protein